jgi:hypothetical protein
MLGYKWRVAVDREANGWLASWCVTRLGWVEDYRGFPSGYMQFSCNIGKRNMVSGRIGFCCYWNGMFGEFFVSGSLLWNVWIKITLGIDEVFYISLAPF